MSCIYDRLATELSGLTWAVKTELSDGLDSDSDLDGDSDNRRTRSELTLGPDQASIDPTT